MPHTNAKAAAAALAVAAALGLALAPTAYSALTGSGQLTDIVSLTTTTGTISGASLSTSTGAPVASSTPFSYHNSNSNVDTFIRFDWGTTPYYGASSGQTSIALRGTTHTISDLLWFKQEVVSGGSTTTTSEYFSPLTLKNAASNTRATWTAAGNACSAWTGTAALGFSAAAAGSFTFKYHAASSPADDAPSTSSTFYYCLDTTNTLVYLGTATSYDTATLIQPYTSDSTGGILKTYQYQFLSGAQSNGNKYCITGYTGSGTSATPDLVQCEKLDYSLLGSTTGRLYPMFDPPAYFPSNNQAGTSSVVTFGVAGTQWNPYAYTTTNTA